MNLVISFANNYCKPTLVLLTSLFINNSREPWDVFLLHGSDLTQHNLMLTQKVCKQFDGVRFHAIEITKDQLPDLPTGNWTIEAWFRQCVISQIPKDVNRILYLDGDIIVTKDLYEFYYQIMDRDLFVACKDMGFTGERLEEEKRRCGLSMKDEYVNAGVLLINLKELRNEYHQADLWSYVESRGNSCFKYIDQSFLNSFFRGRILIEDEKKYNCQINAYPFDDRLSIAKNASIIHFSSFRPWKKGYMSNVGDIWWKYARRTVGWKIKFMLHIIENIFVIHPYRIIRRAYRLFKSMNRFRTW